MKRGEEGVRKVSGEKPYRRGLGDGKGWRGLMDGSQEVVWTKQFKEEYRCNGRQDWIGGEGEGVEKGMLDGAEFRGRYC